MDVSKVYDSSGLLVDIAYDPWPDVDSRIDLEWALKRLSEELRQVILMSLAGYTQAEIAAAQSVTQQAVSARRRRALQQLSELMK